MIRAISVRQPWAWLILYGGKSIENRKWNSRYRGRLLIHAPCGMTIKEYEHAALWLEERRFEIVLPEFSSLVCGAILGECIVTDWVSSSDSPWFVGPHGALLKEMEAYPEPIPCKGRLRLWSVSEELHPLILKQKEGCNRR